MNGHQFGSLKTLNVRSEIPLGVLEMEILNINYEKLIKSYFIDLKIEMSQTLNKSVLIYMP